MRSGIWSGTSSVSHAHIDILYLAWVSENVHLSACMAGDMSTCKSSLTGATDHCHAREIALAVLQAIQQAIGDRL